MLDGEHAQLVHLLKNFHKYKMDSFDISILKLAAACSATQQPCDIMRAFHILHQFYTSKAFIHTNFDNVSIPSYMENVMYAIRDIPAASRKVYENFSCLWRVSFARHTQVLLVKAFTPWVSLALPELVQKSMISGKP